MLRFKARIPNLFPLSAISVLILISRWPGHDSEDIKNLRINAKGLQPNDFWGGASSIFYGHFPNFYPGWESLLLFFQWTLTSVGLILLTRRLQSGRKAKVLWLLISLLVIQLGTLLTRDGLMLALLVFGIGLLNSSEGASPRSRRLTSITALTIFLFAAAFRPWVSPAIAVLYIWVSQFASNISTSRQKIFKRFVLGLVFVLLAFGFEVGSSKILNLEKSYPEQQVMMMDLAPMACWSTNQATVDQAISGLESFYSSGKLPDFFCNTFRPTNWIHLFGQDLVSKQRPDFSLIQVGDYQSYTNVRSAWLKSISSSPVDYMQNKLMYASQTLLGGDTRGIRLLNGKYLEEPNKSRPFAFFSALVSAPLDLAITIHLFSPFFSFLILFLVLISGRLNSSWRSQTSSPVGLWLFILLWFAGTVVAYIGDTARFTYTSGALILMLIAFNQFKSRRNDDLPRK
jgi:hypothetical protein